MKWRLYSRAMRGRCGGSRGADGSAWFVAPKPGEYLLVWDGGAKAMRARAGTFGGGNEGVKRVAAR